MGAKPAKKEHFEYEFFGPVGTLILTFVLPLVILFLYFSCNSTGCLEVNPFSLPPTFQQITQLFQVFDVNGAYIFFGWFFFQAFLYIALPGKWVEGVKLSNGERLKYKMNGLFAYVLSLGGLSALHLSGYIDLAVLYDYYISIMLTAIAFSYALSVYLYATSFIGNKLLAENGNSGNPFYDFWMGRELNPRIGNFDLKVFCELRPGLIGWCALDLAMACKQYQLHGTVTNSMCLILAFQIYYVLDSFMSEPALLTTMDVTDEGFGFMLVFGDLVWVPGLYTFQARYLVDHPNHLTPLMLALVLGVNFLGLIIFRGANSQKDAFRKNPNDPAVKHLKTMPTERGTKLIISGWWGIARHINYLGDMLMGVAWCLPCGFEHVLPYFYVVYFFILLVHRDLRDGDKCAKKYGKDWDKYCSIVRWRIIPYVY
eukprot:comp37205_c0_seq1/m.47342 comp37205_c0_seq1/g.47342  ORF comp37205_c0_seq1/g.47342 comp37205_c0_seq1/m.47342 type:complete len:427 (-) comp37205_c0_seq1:395-1675(-)